MIKSLNLHQLFELLEKFYVPFNAQIKTDGNGLVWYDEYDRPGCRRYVIAADIMIDHMTLRVTARREPTKFGDTDRQCMLLHSTPSIYPRGWRETLGAYASGREVVTERAAAVTRCLARLDDMQAAVDNMRAEAPESCQDLDALIEGSRNDIIQFIK